MKFNKIIALFSIAFFALTACSGGASNESADEVIKKFKQNIKTIDAVDMSIEASMTGEDDTDNIDFNLEADVKLDQKDENDRKADIDLELDGSLEAGGNSLTGDLAVKLLTMGDEFYFNLVKFESNDPNAESYKTLLEPYKGTWQHLASDFVPEDIKKLQKKDAETLQKEAQLKDLFINTKLFNVTKEYGTEKLNGVKVYHYGVKLNENGVKEYVKKAATINERELTEDEVEEATMFVDSVTNMEMWIGAKDYYLYKGTIDLSGESIEEDVTSTIALTYTANSYNTDLKITAPSEYEEFNPLSILMGMQMSGMMEGGSEDATIDDALIDDTTMEDDSDTTSEASDTTTEDSTVLEADLDDVVE